MPRPRSAIEWIAGGNVAYRPTKNGSSEHMRHSRGPARQRTRVEVLVETDSEVGSDSDILSETSANSDETRKKVHFEKKAAKKSALKKTENRKTEDKEKSEEEKASEKNTKSSESYTCECKECRARSEKENKKPGSDCDKSDCGKHKNHQERQENKQNVKINKNHNHNPNHNSNRHQHQNSQNLNNTRPFQGQNWNKTQFPLPTEHLKQLSEIVKQRNMARVIQPSRAEVILREDVIEGPSDPRPNAFFDLRTNMLRVYHGPMYGNSFATLIPVSANAPIGSSNPGGWPGGIGGITSGPWQFTGGPGFPHAIANFRGPATQNGGGFIGPVGGGCYSSNSGNVGGDQNNNNGSGVSGGANDQKLSNGRDGSAGTSMPGGWNSAHDDNNSQNKELNMNNNNDNVSGVENSDGNFNNNSSNTWNAPNAASNDNNNANSGDAWSSAPEDGQGNTQNTHNSNSYPSNSYSDTWGDNQNTTNNTPNSNNRVDGSWGSTPNTSSSHKPTPPAINTTNWGGGPPAHIGNSSNGNNNNNRSANGWGDDWDSSTANNRPGNGNMATETVVTNGSWGEGGAGPTTGGWGNKDAAQSTQGWGPGENNTGNEPEASGW